MRFTCFQFSCTTSEEQTRGVDRAETEWSSCQLVMADFVSLLPGWLHHRHMTRLTPVLDRQQIILSTLKITMSFDKSILRPRLAIEVHPSLLHMWSSDQIWRMSIGYLGHACVISVKAYFAETESDVFKVGSFPLEWLDQLRFTFKVRLSRPQHWRITAPTNHAVSPLCPSLVYR